MKHGKWFFALIIISLAFNFAFIGGFVYHRLTQRKPPALLMEFKDDRRTEMKEKLDGFREADAPYINNFNETRKVFIQSLCKPEFDESNTRELLESAIVQHMNMERHFGENFIVLRRGMTAQEAERFFNHLIDDKQDRNGGPNGPNDDSRGPRRPLPPLGPGGPGGGF